MHVNSETINHVIAVQLLCLCLIMFRFLSRHTSFNEGRVQEEEEGLEERLTPVAYIEPVALIEETDGHRSPNPPPPPASSRVRRRSRDRMAPIYGELVLFG